MSKINNGGPAFAAKLESNRDGFAVTGGMTLRDYFAAKAMSRIVSYDKDGVMSPDTIASASYRLADAMLRAREQS